MLLSQHAVITTSNQHVALGSSIHILGTQ